MATQYGQLTNKGGTIYNTSGTTANTTAQGGYADPNALAKDLGIDVSAIQWGQIANNANYSPSFGNTVQTNTQSNTPSQTPMPTVNTQNTQTPTPTPDTMVGQRPSQVDPKVMEFYNKQTGQGFSTPQELSTFVNQQGLKTSPTTVFEALKQGFNQVKDTTAPQDQGEAGKTIDQVTPGGIVNMGSIEQQLAADPGYQQLLKDYQDYTNTATQSTSLLDTYKQLIDTTGLAAVNTELLNTKKIIEGTEDDIRNEVTAANGFATESQILALSGARNKSLIKNYNALVDHANAIQGQVNTMIGLAGQDRQNALAIAQQKLNIDAQIMAYRDKFVSNAREGYNNYINAVGYSGLYNALQNDPNAMALAERTLGIPSGTIASAAAREYEEQYQKQSQQDFENQIKLAGLDVSRQNANISAANLGLSREKFNFEMQQKMQESQLEMDNKIANIIAANPGEWGKAATQIEQMLGQKIQTGSYYDQLLNKVYGEGQPLTNYLTPQVNEKTLGKIQSSPEYKTINGLLPAIQTIQDYKNSIEKWGTFELWSGQGKGELSGNFGNALAAWKTLAGLGALSGADFALAENAIPQPGLFKKNSTAISKLDTSLKTAVDQAETLSKRLIANYPDAAYLINSQLDQMKVVAYPERYKVGPDGQVYEITK